MPDCIETAFVDISDGASCKFTVGVVYRPPDGDMTCWISMSIILTC